MFACDFIDCNNLYLVGGIRRMNAV